LRADSPHTRGFFTRIMTFIICLGTPATAATSSLDKTGSVWTHRLAAIKNARRALDGG